MIIKIKSLKTEEFLGETELFLMMKILLCLTFSLLFASCMPQSSGGAKSRQTASVGTNSTNNNSGSVNYVNTSELYWYGYNTNTLTLSINANNIVNFYLRGKRIEAFLGVKNAQGILENFNSLYCLEVTFPSPLKSLRTRAVPISFNDYANNKIERLFRVDIDNPTNSGFSCASSPAPANIVFDVTQVCPTCVSTQLATKVRIYKSLGTVMGPELTNSGVGSLDISGLLLRLDPLNNSSSNNGSCSNSNCLSQGYDCCLNGQCIIDGTVKPSSLTDANFLSIVKPSVDNQFSSFTNWPQYYNVCPRTPDPQVTPTPTATPDPGLVSLTQLNNLKNDYYCTQEMAARATSSPYNLFDFSSTNFPASPCTGTAAEIDTCLATYRQTFATSGTMCNATSNLNYLTVMKRVYAMCGCSNTNWSLNMYDPNHPINSCPYFSLKALTAMGIETFTDAQIANVQCSVGDPNPVVTPFQNLEVNVPSRSAPHRFFKSSDGSPLDDIKTAFNSTLTPEGVPFSYLDPGFYAIPNNSSFNMNSILGQFNVDLSAAFPAKVVDINYDTTYVISALSGYYTPCPSCMRDSWFSTFSAHPSSLDGLGVRSIGFSTSRDTFDGNTSGANYEDNHWGRACFVPPTMIPFSHKTASTVSEQRQNRLSVQAAMYVNGYQRDWYGFNKGALIGSFDGVTWFAIGKNRRVRSTSKKLFLAINAPFADLANPSTIVASVREDEGIATASAYDYDFGIAEADSRQNEAGSCQKHHLCEKDSDCITRLGWEYVCADVTSMKTTWPRFDSNGKEIANAASTFGIVNIIQGGALSTSNTKRCVYRGAGALCSTNYSVTPGGSTDPNMRRLLSCAPNFYCADKGASAFNTEIARFATALEDIPLSYNHLYGQDANVLGRPLYYATATASLPSSIQSALTTNANTWGLTGFGTSVGLCRPGRALQTNSIATDLTQTQKLRDTSNRTDYVNQIASCDSNASYASGRYANCPVVDDVDKDSNTTNDGNYRHFASTSTSQTTLQAKALTQNTCGKESQDPTGVNPFYYIESGLLANTNIVDQTLSRDACFRRPGSVCHSDLDCSPNKLHEGQVDNYALSYYGGTIAEQSYWRESLICGQANPKPAVGTTAYNTYDITLNRCCRPIGKDITLYSKTSSASSPDVYLVPSTTANWNKTNRRYSRYLSIDGYPNPLNSYPGPDVSSIANILAYGKQWKTLASAAERTCCGGGWIRKFADGTHTWPIGSRLNFDINNFKCLNYSYDLAYKRPVDVPLVNYSADYSMFCSEGATGTATNNCIQVAYQPNAGTNISSPTPYPTYNGSYILTTKADATQASISTINKGYDWGTLITPPSTYTTPGWVTSPTVGYEHLLFPPLLYSYVTDNTPARPGGWNKPYFPPNSKGDELQIYVPSYIYDNNLSDSYDRGIMSVKLFPESGNFTCDLPFPYTECLTYTSPPSLTPGMITCTKNGVGATSNCQWTYDASNGILKVSRDWDFGTASNVIILIEYFSGEVRKGALPGNDLYYLQKLGRFELLGIPQMLYDPLFCNTNQNELVPDLFTVNTRTAFNSSSLVGADGSNNMSLMADTLNPSKLVAKTSLVNKQPVFSENDVACCLKLGTATTSAGACCSGYMKDNTCKLPPKTDLHVYFNRFVSSDGGDPTGPGGGLLDSDFDNYTGEPKISSDVNTKLYALGTAHCPNGVRQGGAFGKFKAQPAPSSTATEKNIYSIVDSYSDIDTDQDDERGAQAFVDGFRWNHHLYCKE